MVTTDPLIAFAEADFAPRRARARQAQAAATDPGQAVDQVAVAGGQIDGAMGGLIAAIEADGDPLQIQIRRSLVEARLGQALRIPGFRLPSSQELELQAVQGQILLHERRKKLDELVVNDAFGRLMDAKDALGVDESILRDPDNFLAAVERGKQAGVLPGTLDVSRSTLVNAGLESAMATPQERAGKALTTTTENIRKAEAVRETVGEAAAGEGALGQSIDRTVGAFEDRTGLNLGTGLFTDIDERRGAKELQSAYATLRDVHGGVEGNQVLATSLLQRYGPVIKDQLEGLPRNERDELVVGKGSGDAGVDDEAVFYLAGTLMQMAQDTGQELRAVMANLGLEYTGVDIEAFKSEAQRLATERQQGAGQ